MTVLSVMAETWFGRQLRLFVRMETKRILTSRFLYFFSNTNNNGSLEIANLWNASELDCDQMKGASCR